MSKPVTFELWWAGFWKQSALPAVFDSAMKELAQSAWNASALETAAERDRLKEEKVELLVALRLARIALAKAGHHGGVSGVMIEIDNAIAKATAPD